MATGKRFYWLKLKRDFFKRHDVQIIESMPNGKDVCGWHISDLVIYDQPKELCDFGIKRAPQSWCYVRRAV